MICPQCKGEKEGFAFISTDKGCRTGMMPCSTCKGTGEITDEQMANIERGEKLRRDRIDHNQTLRERAAELGVDDFILLNHVEHGRRSIAELQQAAKKNNELEKLLRRTSLV